MKKLMARLCCLAAFTAIFLQAHAQRDIYEIRLYKLKSAEQVASTDNYLKEAYLPVLHRMGIKQIGVFKPISNDTAAVKQIYVIVPYISLDVWRKTKSNIETDPVYAAAEKSLNPRSWKHFRISPNSYRQR
jgi:hypothetical protein